MLLGVPICMRVHLTVTGAGDARPQQLECIMMRHFITGEPSILLMMFGIDDPIKLLINTMSHVWLLARPNLATVALTVSYQIGCKRFAALSLGNGNSLSVLLDA